MTPSTGHDHTDDEKLLALLKSGHEQAFDRLYYRYRNKLYAIAFNRLRSKEAAEEVVQDVFADIWQKRANIRINRNLSAYLCTAVKYAVLDYIRSQKTKDRYVAEMLAVYEKTCNTAEETVEYDELEYHLHKSIDALPARCREVFALSRFENRSVKEIADKLEISPDTAKYHIAHALKQLRLSLKHIYHFFL